MTEPGKGGRPSKAQLAEKAAQEQARARVLAVESKRAAPIQWDQKVTQWIWLGGLFLGFLVAAAYSFNGITSVATLIGLEFEELRYGFFFIVEWLYLVFLGAYLFKQSRGSRGVGAFIGMVYFGGVGIYGNAYHTLSFHEWDYSSADMWTGLVLSISAPIAIIAASKMAATVVFATKQEV